MAAGGITSPKLAPVIIRQHCTVTTDITSSSGVDITGATISITPAVASVAKVTGVFDVAGNITAPSSAFSGLLNVDGVQEAAAATLFTNQGAERISSTMVWLVHLTAAAHILKLQGSRPSGSAFAVRPGGTIIMVELYENSNATDSQ